jgi:hypothetical protein
MIIQLREENSNKVWDLNIREKPKIAWNIIAKYFLRSVSKKVICFPVLVAVMIYAWTRKGSRWDGGLNSRLQRFIIVLSFYWKIFSFASVVRAMRYFSLCCDKTFQSSHKETSYGYPKRHPPGKYGFMSRQGSGDKLKSLHVCILVGESRQTFTNGIREGGWRDH